MLCAVLEDFRELANTELFTLRDARLNDLELPGVNVQGVQSAADEFKWIQHFASSSDWTLLIAPEFDNHLLHRTSAVESSGARLVSPSSKMVAVAADKHLTAQRLATKQIPVPRSELLNTVLEIPNDFPFPAVCKPQFGAGSIGVCFAATRNDLGSLLTGKNPLLVEQFCPGIPVSVGVICGPKHAVPLAPCRQHLSDDGRFRYLGGELPIPDDLSSRATKLAENAVSALPSIVGYLGVDMILGQDPAGSEDYVIEINPRLTTSYVGLRMVSDTNLARVMLEVAEGNPIELSFSSKQVKFKSDGTIH